MSQCMIHWYSGGDPPLWLALWLCLLALGRLSLRICSHLHLLWPHWYVSIVYVFSCFIKTNFLLVLHFPVFHLIFMLLTFITFNKSCSRSCRLLSILWGIFWQRQWVSCSPRWSKISWFKMFGDLNIWIWDSSHFHLLPLHFLSSS